MSPCALPIQPSQLYSAADADEIHPPKQLLNGNQEETEHHNETRYDESHKLKVNKETVKELTTGQTKDLPGGGFKRELSAACCQDISEYQ